MDHFLHALCFIKDSVKHREDTEYLFTLAIRAYGRVLVLLFVPVYRRGPHESMAPKVGVGPLLAKQQQQQVYKQ